MHPPAKGSLTGAWEALDRVRRFLNGLVAAKALPSIVVGVICTIWQNINNDLEKFSRLINGAK